MKRWLGIIFIVVALGGLIGWRLKQKNADLAAQNAQRTARAKAAPVVNLATAVTRDIVHRYQAVGSVQSLFNVNVAPKVTGIIEYLELREGDRVHAGQVLARVDQSQYVAQVEQARASLAEAKQRLTQAQLTQNPTNVQVTTNIRQMAAALGASKADYNQVVQNYNQQVAASEAAVTDAKGRLNVADAGVENAKAGITSAQANLNDALAKYNREDNLYKQGFVAAQDLDDAKAAYDVQRANLT